MSQRKKQVHPQIFVSREGRKVIFYTPGLHHLNGFNVDESAWSHLTFVQDYTLCQEIPLAILTDQASAIVTASLNEHLN